MKKEENGAAGRRTLVLQQYQSVAHGILNSGATCLGTDWYVFIPTSRHLTCQNNNFAKKTITTPSASTLREHGRGRSRQAGAMRHREETAHREVDLIARKLGNGSGLKTIFGQLRVYLQLLHTVVSHLHLLTRTYTYLSRIYFCHAQRNTRTSFTEKIVDETDQTSFKFICGAVS